MTSPGTITPVPLPTPGSPEAKRQGCTCPILDNGHGRGFPGPDGPLFWISADCPIHMREPQPVEAWLDGTGAVTYD